jgi:hypothetical protein
MAKIKNILLISTILACFNTISAANQKDANLEELRALITNVQSNHASYLWLSDRDRAELTNPHSGIGSIIARAQAEYEPTLVPAAELQNLQTWLAERQAFHHANQINH